VAPEGFDSALANMVTACIPRNVFKDVAAIRAVNLGGVLKF
jgi:L-cystine uptake protein TcyP (sodium:dicarboxylate symporter family)